MKKVLALLLAVVMVLSASVSVMAFEDVTEETLFAEAIGYFEEAGVVEGDNGKFLPEGAFTRAAMTKVLVSVLGYTQEDADAKAAVTGFEDVDGVPAQEWAQGWILIAKELGIVEGHSTTNFGAAENVTVGQLATMLARALDLEFEEGTGAEWYASAVEAAVAAGLFEEEVDGAAELKRGEAMNAFYLALDVENAEGETFRTNIEGEEEVVEPVVFAAVSATTANRLDYDVVFTDTVKSTNLGTYKINDVAGAPELLADGKTVRVTVAAPLTNQTSYKVAVANVKSAAGAEIKSATLDLAVADFSVPVLEKVEFVSPTSAKLTFSEPVKDAGTVTVNNGLYIGAVTKYDTEAPIEDTYARVQNVTFGVNFTAGTYSFKVSAFEDPSTFKMAATTVDVEYAAPATPVNVTVVSATQTEVKVKFDRPVTFGATAGNAAAEFYHTYTAWTPYSTNYEASTYVEELTLTFFNTQNEQGNLLQPGAVTLYVKATDNAKDAWGNKLNAASLALNIEVDTTAPSVTSVTAKDQETLQVVFSEKIDLTEGPATFTLVDADGAKRTLEATIDNSDANGLTYTLTDGAALSGTYSLTFSKVYDQALAGNKMADTTVSVTVADVTAMNSDDTFTAEIVSASGDTIYVNYPEAPATSGAYSALDTNNYVVYVVKPGENGELRENEDNDDVYVTLTNSDFTASLFTSKIVKLTITNANKKFAATEGIDVTIGRIADAAGNVPTEFVLANIEAGNAVGASVTGAKVTGYNTVELTVNKELTGINATKFTSKLGEGAAVAVAGATFVNGSNKATVTLTLAANAGNFETNKYVATAPANYKTNLVDSVTISLAAEALTAVNGVKSEAADWNTWTSADGIAPTVARELNAQNSVINSVAVNGATITIKYTEALDANYLSKLSYSVTVAGKSAALHATTAVAHNAGTVTLTLAEAVTVGQTVVVNQNLAVYDAAGNSYLPNVSWTAVNNTVA